ncbi:hypothetical protein BDV26DRAFT_268068 [Aspergillus bertholletiae]|uniref:Polymerase nucleotidyl transferase domain-containing protein n=1 Tax=Aspergillus bertholletiae TaxID=1226010 RepID=A0A5N7AZX0_9EURO|nr:hypothetical protein BDV26DRAFT_268068 [Aspergillus bertholletiae]
MPRILVSHPQCLDCLVIRATMRFHVSAGLLPAAPSSAIRQHTLRSSQSRYQPVPGTRFYSKDMAIFKSSLPRTLEAHRSSNRTSLVRKVFDRKPSEDLTRQVIPAEEALACKLPGKSVPPEAAAQPASSGPPPRTGRNAHSMKHHPILTTQKIPCGRIRWNVNAEQGRWEQSPWMGHRNAGREWPDGFLQLDAEIRALEEYLLPTPPEQERVNHIVSQITNMLRDITPHTPQVIGSRRTGFAMGHSDLDFILPVSDPARSIDRARRPSPTRPQILSLHSELLSRVENILEHCSSFSGQIELSGKWNSTLTAVHHETGMRLQFYCGEGLPSSVEYIRDYHAEYPAIRPLYMVIRLILEAQELFGSHTSSIEPDTLVMLLVAFLKMNHGRFQKSRSLGEQLLAVLKGYGSEVDLRSTCVSVDPPSFFDAATVKDAIQKHGAEDLPAHLRGQRALVNRKKTATIKHNIPAASRLCLQDPANYMNDLGRTCSRTSELQGAFARAYDGLSTCLGTWERRKRGGLQSSLLASALQANFDDFNKARAPIA